MTDRVLAAGPSGVGISRETGEKGKIRVIKFLCGKESEAFVEDAVPAELFEKSKIFIQTDHSKECKECKAAVSEGILSSRCKNLFTK